eukprot:GHVQ01008673.1.p1 GENE.GHVQ01008673.1~~GHVQ01008673.1.p1  ORF type:complete len:162 (-),score=44.25 GHVQ01008673.1:467-952(-)
MKISLTFSGGLELLFPFKQMYLLISSPSPNSLTSTPPSPPPPPLLLGYLISYLRSTYLHDRADLFAIHCPVPDSLATMPDKDRNMKQCGTRQASMTERDDRGESQGEAVFEEVVSGGGGFCTVRAGVLVLINDTDWELCGREEGEVKDGDTVAFISTLHGG